MSKSRARGFPFAKIVVFLAAAFGIGVGLCGLDYFLASKGIGKSTEEFGVGPLDSASLLVMLLSAAGLVLALIAWAIAAFWGSLLSGPKGGEPQKLFNTESRNEDEKPR
jgi:hypothetical protein